jgi:ABC-2 type transport system permease protein
MNKIRMKMRKYATVTFTSFKNQIAYKADLFVQNIFFCLLLFIFISLWDKIFSTRQSVSGYSRNDLVWYFIITEIITLSTQNLFMQISNQVKGGSFAYVLNKPYGYILYSASDNAGIMLYKLVSNSFIGAVIGLAFVGIPSIDLPTVPLIFSSIILGITLNFLILTSIALSALFVEDNLAFFWIYQKIMLIFGIFIPVDIYPGWIFNIARFSPISFITYGPAKLFLKFDMDSFMFNLAGQVSYILLAAGLCIYLYRKGVRHVSIQGG